MVGGNINNPLPKGGNRQGIMVMLCSECSE